jgi:hypothetical protein
VVDEPVDQLAGRAGEPAVRVPAHRGGEVPLPDRPGRRVDEGDEERAVLGRERAERRRHRLRRLADLRRDHRREPVVRKRGQLRQLAGRARGERCEPIRDEATDPLRRQVRVIDDLPAASAHHRDELRRKARRLRVPEEDQRLLLDGEVGGGDLYLGRLRPALDAVLAVDTPQAGAQRRGARRPEQPVALVRRAQHAVELECPAFGRVGPVLRRAERVVGDEHLRPVARVALAELLGADAFVRLPAGAERGQRNRAGDRGLPHLRRAGQHGEAMTAHDGERPLVGSCRREDARERVRGRGVEARAVVQPVGDEVCEIAQAEDGREPEANRRVSVDQRRELPGTEDGGVGRSGPGGYPRGGVRQHEPGGRRRLVPVAAPAPEHVREGHGPVRLDPGEAHLGGPGQRDAERRQPHAVRRVRDPSLVPLGRQPRFLAEQRGAEPLELERAELVERVGRGHGVSDSGAASRVPRPLR